jgi:hypothetical protein
MPELVEGVLDVLGDVVPRLRGLLGGAHEVVDVVVVDVGQHRRAPGGLRLGQEVLERLQAELEHPLGLVLELGDLLDERLRQALRGLERVLVLRIVEPELLFVISVDADQRLLFGDHLGSGHESVDLQLDDAVLDRHGERVDGDVRRQCQGLSGAKIETGAVTRALDRARLLVELALHEVAVIVRAAVLDREQRAAAVEDADLEVVPFDELALARWELVEAADVDHRAQIRPSQSVLKSSEAG